MYQPTTVACGEVGLDYFRCQMERGKEQQWMLLTEVLLLIINTDIPLVLHVRDELGKEEAARDTIECMKTAGVSTNHRVYLHAFNYGTEMLCRWLQSFPNKIIGLSPLILKDHHPELRKIVGMLDSDCFMLESDSPYLVPGYPRDVYPVGTPEIVLNVAKEVAKIRQETTQGVVAVASANARIFFRLD